MGGATRGGTCRAIGKWLRNKRFWSISAFLGFLIVANYLEQYATVWMVDVYRPCMNTSIHDEGEKLHCASRLSTSTASLLVSLIPIGILSSLFFGDRFLNDVPIQLTAKVTVAMVWGCFGSGVAMLIWTVIIESTDAAPTNYVMPLAFFFMFMGFCLGFPLYIPTAVYTVRAGGDHSATLSALLDLIVFLIAGGVTLIGTRLSEHGKITETFFAVKQTTEETLSNFVPNDLVADVGPSFEMRRSSWSYHFIIFTISMLLSAIMFTNYWRLEISSLAKDNMADYVDSWLEKKARHQIRESAVSVDQPETAGGPDEDPELQQEPKQITM